MRQPAMAILLIPAALQLTACTNSLDAIIEAHPEARIAAANANRPLTRGYGDNLGAAVAESAARAAGKSESAKIKLKCKI